MYINLYCCPFKIHFAENVNSYETDCQQKYEHTVIAGSVDSTWY